MQTGFIKKLLFRGILFARSSGRRAFSFALEKTSSFTVISEIRKTRSDRLFQRATPFLFSSFSFQIYTKRERKRERERERELAVRRLNVPRFFSFHLRLFLAHWFPPFLLRFCFLNPLPSPPSLSLFDDRHFIFFTSAFARSSIPPFIFFLDFIPLSRSSRFLSSLPPLYPLDFYSHTLPLSFCPRTHPYPIHQPLSLSLSLSLSLLAGSFSSVSIPLSSCPSLFTSRVLSLLRFFVLSPATHYYFSHGSLRVPLLERPINFAAILRLALSQSWAPSTFLAALPTSASPRLPARVVSRRACKYASVFLRVTRAYIRVHVYTCIRTGACAMHVVPNLHRAFNIGRLRHNFPAGTQSWPTGTRGSLRFIPCTDTRISAEICTKNAAWRGHNSPTWRWFYIRRKIDGADDYRRPISRPFIPRVVAPRVFSTPPSLTRHSPSLFLFSFLVAYFSFFFFTDILFYTMHSIFHFNENPFVAASINEIDGLRDSVFIGG